MEELAARKPIGTTAAAPPKWVSLGVAFGLLSTLSIALYGPIGVSGAYSRVIGRALKAVVPGYAASNAYITRFGELLTTENIEVVGLLIGGFLAARLAGRRGNTMGTEDDSKKKVGRRYLHTCISGLLTIFRARLAGGCTSGHIISGITQLALSGIVFAAAVFGAGIITAKLMQRRTTP